MSFTDTLLEIASHNNSVFRRVEIPLRVSMNTVGTASATWKVEEGKVLAIFGIRGHLSLLDLDLEHATQIGAITSNTRLVDRLVAKAMNCRVELVNNDSKLKLIEDEPMPLSSLMEIAGGTPIDWKHFPHVVPSGHTIKMTAELLDDATGLLGGPTEYGVVLSAALIAR